MALLHSISVNIDILKSASLEPETFLEQQKDKVEQITGNIKSLYDEVLSSSQHSFSGVLSELIIANFDDEQIWQQLELFNSPNIQCLLKNIADITVKSPELNFHLKKIPKRPKIIETTSNVLHNDIQSAEVVNNSLEVDTNDSSDYESEDEFSLKKMVNENIPSDEESEIEKELERMLDEAADNEDEETLEKDFDIDATEDVGKKEAPKEIFTRKPTVVDDQFFSLREMESFLDAEDAKEMNRNKRNEDSESEESDDDDEEGQDAMYSEFFISSNDNQQGSLPSADDPDQESEDDENYEEDDLMDSVENNAENSTLEKRQTKMKLKIAEMEDSAMGEKPWQLKGEVTAVSRPENSLLQEDLDFEHTTRQAPIITEETTKTIEDLIRQRIRDKIYDDVERKVKPSEEMPEFRKRIELDQEKSKKSLADIYEEEYLKQQEKDEEEKEDPKHAEIRKSLQSLFIKLDALSNFVFRPTMPNTEVQIISNMPSITMEEVAPVNVSDAARLAPQEIKVSAKGDMIGETERSETDKKRERRKKKTKQKVIVKAKEKKEKLKTKKLGDPKTDKKKALEILKMEVKSGKDKSKNVKLIEKSDGQNLTSSSQFFSLLQDEVSAQIKNAKEKKPASNKPIISAANFKL